MTVRELILTSNLAQAHRIERHLIGVGSTAVVWAMMFLLYSLTALRVTLSIGVAMYRPGEDVAHTVRCADLALYEAKQAGRNRVMVAPEGTGPVP